MPKIKTITLGELKSHLEWVLKLPDDTEIFFGSGDLDFSRAKARGYRSDEKTPSLVNIEFNQIYRVTVDPDDDA